MRGPVEKIDLLRIRRKVSVAFEPALLTFNLTCSSAFLNLSLLANLDELALPRSPLIVE